MSAQALTTVRRKSAWKFKSHAPRAPKLDRFGFIIEEDEGDDPESPGRGSAPPNDEEIRLEALRTSKWVAMLASWDNVVKDRDGLLKSRVRKGIPDALRSTVWPLLADGVQLKRQNRGLYAQLLTKQPSRADLNCINVDLPRTYPNHTLFRVTDDDPPPATPSSSLRPEGAQPRGQASLKNILCAAAVYDSATGYCQGMAFVAGLLLSYLPEEDAFWTLVALLQQPRYGLAGLYSPGLPRFMELMHVFTLLVDKHLPRLANHLRDLGVDHAMYASQWFITLFTYSAPFDLVTRVWDMWLCEGWKAIFRTALALLKVQESRLLKLEFDELMEALKQLCSASRAEEVVQVGLALPLARAHIERLAEDYRKAHAEEITERVRSAKADAVRKETMMAAAESERQRAAALEAAARRRPTQDDEDGVDVTDGADGSYHFGRVGKSHRGRHRGASNADSTTTAGSRPGTAGPAGQAAQGSSSRRSGEDDRAGSATAGSRGPSPALAPPVLPLSQSGLRPGLEAVYVVSEDGALVEVPPFDGTAVPADQPAGSAAAVAGGHAAADGHAAGSGATEADILRQVVAGLDRDSASGVGGSTIPIVGLEGVVPGVLRPQPTTGSEPQPVRHRGSAQSDDQEGSSSGSMAGVRHRGAGHTGESAPDGQQHDGGTDGSASRVRHRGSNDGHGQDTDGQAEERAEVVHAQGDAQAGPDEYGTGAPQAGQGHGPAAQTGDRRGAAPDSYESLVAALERARIVVVTPGDGQGPWQSTVAYAPVFQQPAQDMQAMEAAVDALPVIEVLPTGYEGSGLALQEPAEPYATVVDQPAIEVAQGPAPGNRDVQLPQDEASLDDQQALPFMLQVVVDVESDDDEDEHAEGFDGDFDLAPGADQPDDDTASQIYDLHRYKDIGSTEDEVNAIMADVGLALGIPNIHVLSGGQPDEDVERAGVAQAEAYDQQDGHRVDSRAQTPGQLTSADAHGDSDSDHDDDDDLGVNGHDGVYAYGLGDEGGEEEDKGFLTDYSDRRGDTQHGAGDDAAEEGMLSGQDAHGALQSEEQHELALDEHGELASSRTRHRNGGSMASILGAYRSSAAIEAHIARMSKSRAIKEEKIRAQASQDEDWELLRNGRAPFRLDLTHRDEEEDGAQNGMASSFVGSRPRRSGVHVSIITPP